MQSKFQHHDASFAMLHASSAVGKTEWEGTDPKLAFQYMYGLVNLPTYKQKLGLNDTEHKNVNTALKGLLEFHELFRSFVSDDELKIDHPKLLSKIKSITSELPGVCYLPSGWISDKCGHFLGIKMRQIIGTTYACSSINRGAGADYHRTLQDAKTRYKIDFQSAEYEIDLSSELGRYFLEAIITMTVEKKLFSDKYLTRKIKGQDGETTQNPNSYKSQLTPYDTEDLYSLFALCGKQITDQPINTKRAASLQRSGTCTITNTKSIIHDCILMTSPDCDEEKITKFTFILKLASLVEAQNALLKDSCHQPLFEWALHEAGVRLAKEAPKALAANEEAEYRQSIQTLQKSYQEYKNAQIEKACQTKSLPPLHCTYKPQNHDNNRDKKTESTEAPSTSAEEEIGFDINKPKSDQVFDYIANALKYFERCSSNNTPKSLLQHKYIAFMRSLPPTSGESEDTFWDAIPENIIVNILQYFCDLQRLMHTSEKPSSLYSFETALIAYDIAAQLTPRIDDLRLGDSYTLGLSDVITDKNTFFDPITYQTVKQIRANFQRRQAKKQIIFCNYLDKQEPNQEDKTVEYMQKKWFATPIVAKLLSKLKKEEFVKEKTKEEELSLEYKTNVLLTQSAPKNLSLETFDTAPIVGHPFTHILQLSATLHSMGSLVQSYRPLQNNKMDRTYDFETSLKLCFNDNTVELRNKILSEELDSESHSSTCTEIVKRIPNLLDPNQQPGDFIDVLENTLSHPVDDWRALSKNIDETETLPYALKPSGSFQLSTPAWPSEQTTISLQTMESFDETMRRIEASGTMKANQLLAWAQQNVKTLIIPEIRQSILNILFSYGSLDYVLSQHPTETIELINQFLHNAFNYCTTRLTNRQDQEQNGALTFLCQIQYHLVDYTTHMAKLYNFKADNLQPINFPKALKNAIHSPDDANQIIVSYSQHSKLDDQDYASVLIAKFICATNSTPEFNKLDLNQEDAWESLSEQVNKYCCNLSSSELNDTMNKVVNVALKMKGNRKWTYKDGQLHCKSIKLSFNIKSGVLSRNKSRIIDFTKIAISWPVFKKLKLNIKTIKLFEDTESISTGNSMKVLKTADQQWEFRYSTISQELKETKRKIIIDNETHHMKLQGETKWVSQNNESIHFIETDEHAYIYHPDTGRRKVELQPDGRWKRDGTVILDLEKGVCDLEVKWREFFEGKVDLATVTIETKDLGRRKLQIESMNLKSLKLSFTQKNNKMASDQYPGYFLSEKTHIPELHKINTLIMLCNDKNDYKYILPAYSLNPAEDPNNNAAFTRTNIFSKNYSHIPVKEGLEQRYFEYTFDKNDNFIGHTVEAELYLAVIYRALGDYQRAINSIKKSYDFRANTEAQAHLINMIITRPDLSPLGAALDCHLACRVFRQQRKWTNPTPKEKPWAPFNDSSSNFSKHIKNQYQKYQYSISSKREAIFIIPSYLRLKESDQKDLAQAIHAQADVDKDILTNNYNKITFNRSSLTTLHRWLKNHMKIIRSDMFQKQEKSMPFSLRAYYNKDEILAIPNKEEYYDLSSSLEKFLRYYVNLYEDALSMVPATQKATRAKIFYLKHGDKRKQCNELYDTLNLVSEFPEALKEPNRTFTSTYECLEHVIQAISSMIKNKWENLTINAMDPIENTQNKLEFKTPKPPIFSDFIECTFNLDKYPQSSRERSPYQDAAEKFIRTEKKPSNITTPLLHCPQKASLIEQKLINRLNQGHEQNSQTDKIQYSFSIESLEPLEEAIKQSIKEDQVLQRAASQKILSAITTTHDDSSQDYLQALQNGQQIPALSPDDIIFDCLLTQNFTKLQQANPLLKQNDIDDIIYSLCDYAVIKTRIDLGHHILSFVKNKNTISDLTEYQQQKLAQTIKKERAYDIREYPEFLVYEYATQRILRENQVEALIKLISYAEQPNVSAENPKHALLQFAAGGGKTSVMIPVLAQRFARKGMLPIIFNTNELYDIGIQEIPTSLKNSFRQHIEVIEKDLNHQWTVKEFATLGKDIKAWHQAGKCILLKPTTWHAINACKRMTYEQKDQKLRSAASRVLNYLKQHAVKLEDEGHIISDPLRKSIKTFGAIQQIPLAQQKLIVAFYDYLLNKKDDAQAISDLAGIVNRSKKHLADNEIASLKALLIDKTILFDVFSALDTAILKSYLAQASNKRPQFLVDLREKNPELAGLVVLARAFIQTLLPHILTLQFTKDFGHSINVGDLTAAPKRNATDVSSHFSDQILVLSLSIQLYHMSGVPEQDISNMIELFLNRHESERRWNQIHETNAEIELNNLLPNGYKLIDLDALTNDQQAAICSDNIVRFDQKIINRFLFDSVFRQVGAPKYRVESTAADFQAGFMRSIIFSATPTLAECYPEYLDKSQFHDLPSFEAQVVSTLLHPKNQSHCILKMTDQPKDMFDQIKKEHPDIFTELRALIDAGALYTDLQPKAVVRAILSTFDKSHISTAVCFDQKNLTLQSKQEHLDNIKIVGTDVLRTLEQQGINPNQFLLFLFLDLSRTTGTDLIRPDKDHAALTIGKGQILTNTIQAAMRERKLLEDNAQTLTWIIFKSLYQKINNSTDFDLEKVIYWMIKNESNVLQKKVINRAYQGIDQILRAYVEDNYPNSATKMSKLIQSHSVDPYLMYEIESELKDPNTVLNSYIDSTCQFFDINQARDLTATMKKRLKSIVDETQTLIEQLRQPHGAILNEQQNQEQQCIQETEQEQEMEQEQRLLSLDTLGYNFKFSAEHYTLAADNLMKVFEAKSDHYQLLALPGCDKIKTPKLLINIEHFQPVKTMMTNSKEITWLKPIQGILIKLSKDGQSKMVACTAAGIQYFEHQIKQLDNNGNSSFAILGVDGKILCANDSMSERDRLWLKDSDDVDQMSSFVSFLNGKIDNPSAISKVIKQYGWSKDDYQKLTQSVLISRQPINLTLSPLLSNLFWPQLGKQDPSIKPKKRITGKIRSKILTFPVLPAKESSQRQSNATAFNKPYSLLPQPLLERQLITDNISEECLEEISLMKTRNLSPYYLDSVVRKFDSPTDKLVLISAYSKKATYFYPEDHINYFKDKKDKVALVFQHRNSITSSYQLNHILDKIPDVNVAMMKPDLITGTFELNRLIAKFNAADDILTLVSHYQHLIKSCYSITDLLDSLPTSELKRKVAIKLRHLCETYYESKNLFDYFTDPKNNIDPEDCVAIVKCLEGTICTIEQFKTTIEKITDEKLRLNLTIELIDHIENKEEFNIISKCFTEEANKKQLSQAFLNLQAEREKQKNQSKKEDKKKLTYAKAHKKYIKRLNKLKNSSNPETKKNAIAAEKAYELMMNAINQHSVTKNKDDIFELIDNFEKASAKIDDPILWRLAKILLVFIVCALIGAMASTLFGLYAAGYTTSALIVNNLTLNAVIAAAITPTTAISAAVSGTTGASIYAFFAQTHTGEACSVAKAQTEDKFAANPEASAKS